MKQKKSGLWRGLPSLIVAQGDQTAGQAQKFHHELWLNSKLGNGALEDFGVTYGENVKFPLTRRMNAMRSFTIWKQWFDRGFFENARQILNKV